MPDNFDLAALDYHEKPRPGKLAGVLQQKFGVAGSEMGTGLNQMIAAATNSSTS